MNKLGICILLFSSVCVSGFSQNSINQEIIENFLKNRKEINDYFYQNFRNNYANDMMYYEGRLMTWIPNMMDRQFFSDDIDKTVIDLYRKTLALRVPREYRQMYINAGLGDNGHETFIKIISIMYFNMLERRIESFSAEVQVRANNSLTKFKELFTNEEWDLVTNYLNNR